MLKLDTKKPYGTITGHQWARYEQNGILFDYQGQSRVPVDLEEETDIPSVTTIQEGKDFELEHAKEFLKNILSSGPLTKTAIYKECENNNQEWGKVETAFALIGGEKLRRGNWTLWKLKTE